MASWTQIEQDADDFLRALHEGDLDTMARIAPASVREYPEERRRETVAEMAARMRPELSAEMREAWIESRR
jgi:hypothetical protein